MAIPFCLPRKSVIAILRGRLGSKGTKKKKKGKKIKKGKKNFWVGKGDQKKKKKSPPPGKKKKAPGGGSPPKKNRNRTGKEKNAARMSFKEKGKNEQLVPPRKILYLNLRKRLERGGKKGKMLYPAPQRSKKKEGLSLPATAK